MAPTCQVSPPTGDVIATPVGAVIILNGLALWALVVPPAPMANTFTRQLLPGLLETLQAMLRVVGGDCLPMKMLFEPPSVRITESVVEFALVHVTLCVMPTCHVSPPVGAVTAAVGAGGGSDEAQSRALTSCCMYCPPITPQLPGYQLRNAAPARCRVKRRALDIGTGGPVGNPGDV